MSAPLGQKVLAGFLTFLLFALVIFGLGAAFDQFGERAWGYGVGIGVCVIMVVAGVAAGRRDE
ncbi:hypothetical protein CcI49_15220 [Frankia sp. CcI49]|uniref:Uncharacterized protein n=1 Tax=Parafrankia irregularis TaxID=795642 RepID=A0A0S4QI90_9ACTN|nr:MULTISPECIES: hypothetical protein [Frankiaceae]KPM51419.1 hypothetical protein ACG83_35460 [Frankia sp. R43]MBE3202881.1 hypothetical protein [Parafrankia sp. CH37]ONH59674.1 hypothetical protein CcI49_15220 [Frankia sp. CcI49]CUU54492.1 hypothetical protein Ga0074812_102502 [Parafrankia irregularis]